MKKLENKSDFDRALRRHTTWAEWRHLKRTGLVSEYLRHDLRWKEFRDFALMELDRIRSFYEDKLYEKFGELESETELGVDLDHDLVADQPNASSSLSKRTVARAGALSALNRLHTGGRSTLRPIIHSTHKPRGGVDGTVPQWVIFLGVEAWVPAEEVKEAYRTHQQALLAEQAPPKTQERAFEVARLVWEEARQHGKRPPWRMLWERWNNWPTTKPFNSWRDFRTYYLRGEKATRPRYFAGDEQMTKQVESGAHERAFEIWVSSFRE